MLATVFMLLSVSPIATADTQKYQEAAVKSSSNIAKESSIINLNDIINSNLSSTKVSLEERLKRIEEKQAEITENRRVAREIYSEHNKSIAKQLSESENITYISMYSPLLICNLSKGEALNIAKDNKFPI